MALAEDASHELGPAFHLLADDEERGQRTRGAKRLKDRRGPLRMGPVVEGEHHARSPRQRARKGQRLRGVCIDWCQGVAQHPPIIAQSAIDMDRR
jgi:hypothetical protein